MKKEKKMRKTIVVAIMILFSLAAWTDDLVSMGLRGKVKMTNEKEYGFVQVFGQFIRAKNYTESNTYSYDAKGKQTEEAWYIADGSLDSKRVYSYDANENVTEWARYNADGSLASKTGYAYEYDSEGNWTNQVKNQEVTKFGKTYFEPQMITIREITYYP
jgi:hypothetical protein